VCDQDLCLSSIEWNPDSEHSQFDHRNTSMQITLMKSLTHMINTHSTKQMMGFCFSHCIGLFLISRI